MNILDKVEKIISPNIDVLKIKASKLYDNIESLLDFQRNIRIVVERNETTLKTINENPLKYVVLSHFLHNVNEKLYLEVYTVISVLDTRPSDNEIIKMGGNLVYDSKKSLESAVEYNNKVIEEYLNENFITIWKNN